MILDASRALGLAILAALSSAPAEATEPCAFVVSDFARTGKGVSAAVAEGVAARAEVGVKQVITDMSVPCRLRSRERTRAQVRAATPTCGGADCFVPFLEAIDADFVLSGTVAEQDGGGLVVRVQLLDRGGHILETGAESASDADRLESGIERAASSLARRALARRFGTLVSFHAEVDGARVLVAGDAHVLPADVWVLPDQQVIFFVGGEDFRVSTSDLTRLQGSGALVTLRDHRVAGAVVKTGVTLAFTVAGGVLARLFWKPAPDDPKFTVDDQHTLHTILGAGAGFLVGVLVGVPLGNAVAKPTVDVERRSLPAITLSPGGLGLESPAFTVAIGPGGLSGTFY